MNRYRNAKTGVVVRLDDKTAELILDSDWKLAVSAGTLKAEYGPELVQVDEPVQVLSAEETGELLAEGEGSDSSPSEVEPVEGDDSVEAEADGTIDFVKPAGRKPARAKTAKADEAK